MLLHNLSYMQGLLQYASTSQDIQEFHVEKASGKSQKDT